MTNDTNTDFMLQQAQQSALSDQQAREAFVLQAENAQPIQSQEEFVAFSASLQGVKERIKAIEAERTSFTGPLNKILKKLNDVFRPQKQDWERAEVAMKARMGAYQRRVDEEHARSTAAAQAALPAPGQQATPQQTQQYYASMSQASQLRPPEAAGITMRPVAKWRVIDAAVIPRELLMLDEKKVNAFVKKHGKDAKIPGIEIYMDTQVISRAPGAPCPGTMSGNALLKGGE